MWSRGAPGRRVGGRGRQILAAALAASLALASVSCTKKNSGASSSGNSDQLSVAFVPKIQGVPYFEAMNAGAAKAAKKLDIDWQSKGPTTADPGEQTEIVKSFIQQDVDVLIIAPNDPNSMAPVIKQARNKGIRVMTSDTDAPSSEREVFVSQATSNALGSTIADGLAEAMQEKGKFAIVSCGRTAANLNSWIKVEKQVIAEKYPDMELVDVVYAGEDQAKGTSMAKDLMNANPDLNGLIGQCTTSAPAVAKAVREAGKVDDVATVGLGTPKTMKPYLEDGSSALSVLWDVEALGYLSAWAAKRLHSDQDFAAKNKVSKAIPAAKWTPKSKTLLLGDPLRITADNAGDYDY